MRSVKSWMKVLSVGCSVAMLMAAVATAQTAKSVKTDTAKSAAPAKQLKPQTSCPVMGEPINKSLYVDYNGRRIYVCCSACIADVKKDPEKFIKKLESTGQGVERTTRESKKATIDTSASKTEIKGMKMAGDTATEKAVDEGYWTCSMHPEIHNAAAGNCPKCGMKLVFKQAQKDTPATKDKKK